MINPLRQCCITKKRYPRSELWRLIRLPDNTIILSKYTTVQGRSLHFSPSPKVLAALFTSEKRRMVNHFLRADIAPDDWEKICKKALHEQC